MDMAVSRSWRYHGGMVWTWIPSSEQYCRRDADICQTPSIRLFSVFRCLLIRNNKRDGVIRISLSGVLAIAAISSVGVATGGG